MKLVDIILIKDSIQGNHGALEKLIRRYQHWLYNLVLRMVGDPFEAEDITQEILIKIITKLPTFKGKSEFKTWLYRIACNHVINIKKCSREKKGPVTFSTLWKNIQSTPDFDFADTKIQGVETKLIVDEIKFECMLGMLICLKPVARLAFILGVFFQFEDTVASEMMGITRVNFRKILSRARNELFNFMNDKCSLMKPGNPCQCKRKLKSMLAAGYIDPKKLRFNSDFIKKVRQMIPKKMESFNDVYDSKVIELFRDQPFKNQPDFNKRLAHIINTTTLLKIFSLDKIPARQKQPRK
ncbi:MAG: RNA polymerase sigma factor [Spirochaetales bacterium]|nr:RNA polymerase sigma factor [Spirochaetales bacterium]